MKLFAVVCLMALMSAAAWAQRAVSVNLAGMETKIGSEVYAMGDLQENEDGTAYIDLYNMQMERVGRYDYRKFGEPPVKRDFQYEGESYLHLPLMTGDTLYRHSEYMMGVEGRYSTFKGHYELWAPRSRADEYGKVVLTDGIVEIAWYSLKNDSLLSVNRYSSITPTTVKLEGKQVRYYKGRLSSIVCYEKDVRITADYFDEKGYTERKYAYGKNGDYQMWQYYPPREGEVTGALKRHEVCEGKNCKPNGELYDENGKKIKFVAYRVQPEYPGGEENLMKFIRKELKYPKEAVAARVQGRVMLEIKIDSLGKVSNIKVLQTPHAALSTEAIRVVNHLKPFKPGMLDGKAVNVKYQLPITFYLNGR